MVSAHSNDFSDVSRFDIIKSTRAAYVSYVYDSIEDFSKSSRANVDLDRVNKYIIGKVTNEIKEYQNKIKEEVEKEKAKELIEKLVQELDEVSKYKYILEQTKDKELERLMKTAGFLE